MAPNLANEQTCGVHTLGTFACTKFATTLFVFESLAPSARTLKKSASASPGQRQTGPACTDRMIDRGGGQKRGGGSPLIAEAELRHGLAYVVGKEVLGRAPVCVGCGVYALVMPARAEVSRYVEVTASPPSAAGWVKRLRAQYVVAHFVYPHVYKATYPPIQMQRHPPSTLVAPGRRSPAAPVACTQSRSTNLGWPARPI